MIALLRQWLRNFFRVPGTWTKEYEFRRAQTLHVSHVFALSGACLYFAIPAEYLNGQSVFVLGTIVYAIIGSLFLRYQMLTLSGLWSTGVMWAIFSLGSLTEGGVTSSSFGGTVVIVVFAGLVFGLRGALLGAIGSIAVGALAVYLLQHGLLPEPAIVYTPMNVYGDLVIYLIAAALLIGIAINHIEHSTRQFEGELANRSRIEDELRQSELRYRVLSDAAFEGLALIDNEVIVDGNRQLASLLGVEVESLPGRIISDFLPPEDVPIVQQAMESGSSGPFFHRIVRPDGKVVPVEMRARLTRYMGRDVWLSALRDLTEKFESEHARRQLEEQLRHSQKMEAIGRLAGGIAHDFNNLLSIILGYSEMILKRLPKDHDVALKVAQIQGAGKRASSLTKQLLAYSRKQTLEMVPLEVNALVADLTQMLQRLIGEDIALVTHFGSDAGCVNGDKTQIEQVLINLSINSRDAMERGGTLTITTGTVVVDQYSSARYPDLRFGDYTIIRVSDTGSGMDEHTLQNAFEPFFTTKGFGKGTGLGLSTVYGIVKQHQGNILASSTPGAGTTMTVLLPQTPERPTDLLHEPATDLKVQKGKTILLVEDEDGVRILAEEALSSHGYAVIQTDDPEKATDLVLKGAVKPDLLVSDVIMPHMNGNELYVLLKQQLPQLQVLFISGYSDEILTHRGILNPGTELLQKPFTIESLIRRVGELIAEDPALPLV